MRTGKPIFDREAVEYPCAWRIIPGLILTKVNGFSTPLACLWRENADTDQCRRVAEYLIKDRRFIPVTVDGYIFGAG